jgi:hypothetical protein
VLQNTTAATSGNQKWSPRLHWSGSGYGTTGSAAQTVDWIAELQPVQGAAAPTNQLVFSYQTNGAGFTKYFVLGSLGLGSLSSGSTASATDLTFNNAAGNPQLVITGANNLNTSVINTNAGGGLQVTSLALLQFNGNANLTSPSAATFQLGAADAAAPVAQTLQAQSVVAGTSNTSGVNWTHIGSLSTGSGTSGDMVFQTGGTGAGATVKNTAVTAMTIKGATQTVVFATNIQIQVSPTANTSASTLITSGADSSTNLGHRIIFNLNGTNYWIPAGSVAF